MEGSGVFCFSFFFCLSSPFLCGMVRALSNKAKQHLASSDREKRLNDAVSAYRSAKLQGSPVTYRALEDRFDIPYRIIQWHVGKHNKTVSQAAEEWSRLSHVESQVVLDNALHLAERGVALMAKDFARRASAIIKARDGPDAKPLGHNWAHRFLTRNLDQVSMYWGSCINSKRGRAINPIANGDYWDVMEKLIVGKIKSWRMYGMDEIDCMLGYAPCRRVAGPPGQKIQHDQADGNWEMVTVVNTICADGTYLKPIVVYKGKNFLIRWTEQENPIEVLFMAFHSMSILEN